MKSSDKHTIKKYNEMIASVKQDVTSNIHMLREYTIRKHLKVNHWKTELKKETLLQK